MHRGKAPRGQTGGATGEVVLPQALQPEALLNVLERQGVIKKADFLQEIGRLTVKRSKAT